MLDSTICSLHLIFISGFIGKVLGREEGLNNLKVISCCSTVGTVGCCDVVAATHSPSYCGAGTALGLPSSSFSFPVSKQHQHIVSGAPRSCKCDGAGSSAVAPRQSSAELARE